MSFNLATCGARASSPTITVDAHLTQFKPYNRDGAATITTDIGIYDTDGNMEIQVEGLVVASFASTKASNDYELYLHTVMETDPEHEIVQPTAVSDSVLIESCERVAAFFAPLASAHLEVPLNKNLSGFETMESSLDSLPQWTGETETSLNDFIHSSPYYLTLDFIRTLGNNLPDVLRGMLPTVIQEARRLETFQKHMAQVSHQIAHRYPRMKILGLTDPEFGFTEHVLNGLQDSFVSYTIGSLPERNLASRMAESEPFKRKVVTQYLNFEENLGDQLPENVLYDMVILSTSIIRNQHIASVLKQVRQLMKAGGFLILIDVSMSSLKNRLRRCTDFRSEPDGLLTPPDWPDALEDYDFVRMAKHSDQYHSPGYSLIVRQASSERTLPLQIMSNLHKMRLTDHLLIIGGKGSTTTRLANDLGQLLKTACGEIHFATSLEDVDPDLAASCTGVILLSSIDQPLLTEMTSARLEMFHALIRPGMRILWLTVKARTEPEQAASLGFVRTLLAETPGLVLRVLDIDTLENGANVIAEEFARLTTNLQGDEAQSSKILWTDEPEVYIEKGTRLIPRVLPYQAANNRVNASRRIVTETLNSLETPVEVIAVQGGDGSTRYETKLSAININDPIDNGLSLVQLYYCSLDVINLGWTFPSYVYVGQNVGTGQIVTALGKSNGSFVSINQACMTEIPANIEYTTFIAILCRMLVAITIVQNVSERPIILVEPDDLFTTCLKTIIQRQSKKFLRIGNSHHVASKFDEDTIVLHSRATSRDLKGVFPTDGATIFDFLPDNHPLSQMILEAVPDNCQYNSRYSLMNSEEIITQGDSQAIKNLWDKAVFAAIEMTASTKQKTITSDITSVMSLVQSVEPKTPFKIVDWKVDRKVTCVTKSLVEARLLRPYKTYVLIGLTRDMGQSLCRLFAEHGARNIVLASRSPNTTPVWRDELRSRGVNVEIERLDVTSLADVHLFRDKLAKTMPPIGGVVNGAMVLDDKVFSQMDVETWSRVMAPKTTGSKNLDIVCNSPDIEFFIMTSSFAAIGGHAGQSNYAAANMVMSSDMPCSDKD